MKKYYAYILHCADDTYYCGYTADIAAREAAHNSGKGAKYTRTRLPAKIEHHEEFDTKSDALKRECELKKLTHAQKKKMCEMK